MVIDEVRDDDERTPDKFREVRWTLVNSSTALGCALLAEHLGIDGVCQSEQEEGKTSPKPVYRSHSIGNSPRRPTLKRFKKLKWGSMR